MENNHKIIVLFVNMVNPANEIENLYPPLGPAYLVSYTRKYLRDDKYKIEFRMISNDFENKILEIKPDIIGITCVSQNYNKAKKLADFSKTNGVQYVLIGGSHISLYPNSLDDNIDIGVIGEGEITFLELMKLFVKKRRFEINDLSNVKGLVFWDKNQRRITENRDLAVSLDDIPMPDRGLFKVDPDKAYMFTSRGCPYRCIFCASSRLWKRTRFHSANYVFNEIKLLKNKYGVRRIDFYDDLFIANKERIRQLIQLLKNEGFDKEVQFHISGRANLINKEICQLLKQMNVRGVSLGLESGSPEILKYLKGGNVTVKDNFSAVETIKKHRMYCIASFVIGVPIDTAKTILETLNFIKKSKLDEFAVYVLTPFPGTPIWDHAVSENLIPPVSNLIDWSKIDVEYSRSHNYNIHLAKNLTRNELYKLYLLFEKERQKRNFFRAVKIFFTDPPRFFYHVNKRIRKFFINLNETT